MRILYAVQATGNGHITRARAMLPALQQAGISVDFLFSGRPREQLFDMQCFGDFRHYQGFTFKTEAGSVKRWQTLKAAGVTQFFADVRSIDLSGYDLLLNDFEPVTAWAAKRQKLPSLGLAHQYALRYRLPGTRKAFWLKRAIDTFTPLDRCLGVHWQAFDQPILPPLLALNAIPPTPSDDQQPFVLVYLPFEVTDQVVHWLQSMPGSRFMLYADVPDVAYLKNVILRPLSRETFPRDLHQSHGVICNTGFGLCSEALMLGKKILTKPLSGQIEQYSNACILEQMQRATVMQAFDEKLALSWLEQPNVAPVVYPDVAQHLARWLKSGTDLQGTQLVARVWQEVSQRSV
ncbi:MJ1255/VC2487 family glycosyltransferase [Nitrincola sp.]|uniref:MJ1255/VC2487 family glycosyltransferase n=1 Tax=Nitrincola sp. TaxID=1926584 RepID=UPI003A92E7AA